MHLVQDNKQKKLRIFDPRTGACSQVSYNIILQLHVQLEATVAYFHDVE